MQVPAAKLSPKGMLRMSIFQIMEPVLRHVSEHGVGK